MKQPQLTPEQLLAHVEKEFHESNALWKDAAATYSNSGLKLFDDMIKFVYQVLTSMGIVAGFGFAGIQGVNNLYLFGLGELIMFGAMMFGMYQIKRIYKSNADSVENKAIEIRVVFEKKANLLGAVMKDIIEKGEVKNDSYVTKYEEVNKEILAVFGADKPPVKNNDESWFITYMIMFFIIGFVLLLSSFLPLEKDINTMRGSRFSNFNNSRHLQNPYR